MSIWYPLSVRPKVWLIAAQLLLVSALQAQKDIRTQNNGWISYNGNHRLTDRWGIHTEYVWRRNEYFQHWMQSLIRVAADYYSKPGPQFALGYCFVDTYEYGVQPAAYRFEEHRVFEQISTTQTIGRFLTSGRLRIEQRWLENKTKSASGEYVRDESQPMIYRNRVRYRYMINLPISRRTMENGTLFVSLADEVFINAGKEIKLNVFDQNRLALNLGWRIDANRNIQVGYLNHYIQKGDAKRAERNHTLQISIAWGLDLRSSAAS